MNKLKTTEDDIEEGAFFRKKLNNLERLQDETKKEVWKDRREKRMTDLWGMRKRGGKK